MLITSNVSEVHQLTSGLYRNQKVIYKEICRSYNNDCSYNIIINNNIGNYNKIIINNITLSGILVQGLLKFILFLLAIKSCFDIDHYQIYLKWEWDYDYSFKKTVFKLRPR